MLSVTVEEIGKLKISDDHHDRVVIMVHGMRRVACVVIQRGPQLEVLAVNSLDDETFYASPAIVGNEIYLRGDKHLFRFSKSPGQ